MKEQKACFSCLKKGKGHTTAICFRMKECSENNGDGTLCTKPHHKCIHPENSSPVQVSSLQEKGKSLLSVIMDLSRCLQLMTPLLKQALSVTAVHRYL